MSKIQILKATHNCVTSSFGKLRTVSRCQRYKFWKQLTTSAAKLVCNRLLFHDVKDTNFESNSQPVFHWLCGTKYCFTMSKIQILKATHNNAYHIYSVMRTVSRCQRYKFWKQLTTPDSGDIYRRGLFHDVKDTNFESNSQLFQLSEK